MAYPTDPSAFRLPNKRASGDKRSAELESARDSDIVIEALAAKLNCDPDAASIAAAEEANKSEEIQARKDELSTYGTDLLRGFAVKRHVDPSGTHEQIIDGIISAEYE